MINPKEQDLNPRRIRGRDTRSSWCSYVSPNIAHSRTLRRTKALVNPLGGERGLHVSEKLKVRGWVWGLLSFQSTMSTGHVEKNEAERSKMLSRSAPNSNFNAAYFKGMGLHRFFSESATLPQLKQMCLGFWVISLI